MNRIDKLDFNKISLIERELLFNFDNAINQTIRQDDKSNKKSNHVVSSMDLDVELLRKSASGDRRAQYKFYKQSFSLLMGICMRYAANKDDAMALLNQGYLKILMHGDSYDPTIPLNAWMRRIMINTAIDDFRSTKRYKEQTDIVDFADPETAAQYVDASVNEYALQVDSEDLLKMIAQLPSITGKVFNLFAIDGYAHKEIGVLLGISEGTSKWHVNNARNQLKSMFRLKYNTVVL